MDLDIEPDVNCIESGLYLSDRTAACNPGALKALGITHILTVDTEPLPAHITDGKSRFRTLYIEAGDGTHDDLLSHFDKTNKFIEEGVAHGSVLVHCFFGISRSATLVVAYVMKHTTLSVQEAVAKVREKRPVISPNLGFLAQLKLYYRMGCRLDVDNISYKLFKLENLAAILKKGRNFELVKKVVAKDPGVPDANVNTDSSDVQNVYRCKCCRRQLFSTANLLVHVVGKKPTWNDATWQVDEESEEAEEEGGGICSRSLFAEPIEWMEETLVALQGKLFCPNCKSKVGSFNWLGIQCSCGVKVVPGFHVSLSKVDECKTGTARETPPSSTAPL